MPDTPAATDRTLPDGRQRSPRPGELVRAAGSVARRLPGMAVMTARYLRTRSAVDHDVTDHDGPAAAAPDGERAMPGDPATVLRRSAGRGPLYRRTYEVVVEGARTGPEELITRLINDPNRASPTEVSTFRAFGPGRDPGAEFAVRMPGPWDAPVRVVERTPTSFCLATLRGHMEAGEIAFRAAWADGGRLVFTIESWARSGDRLHDWLHDKLPLAREMQLHMWVEFCEQAAELAGGDAHGPVRVRTDRWRDGG